MFFNLPIGEIKMEKKYYEDFIPDAEESYKRSEEAAYENSLKTMLSKVNRAISKEKHTMMYG